MKKGEFIEKLSLCQTPLECKSLLAEIDKENKDNIVKFQEIQNKINDLEVERDNYRDFTGLWPKPPKVLVSEKILSLYGLYEEKKEEKKYYE